MTISTKLCFYRIYYQKNAALVSKLLSKNILKSQDFEC